VCSSDLTAAQLILLLALTHACLGVATSLPRRRRFAGALAFAAGLMISILSLNAISGMGFSPVPPYSSSLSPALARFAAADDSDAFLRESAALFDQPLFTAKDDHATQQAAPMAVPPPPAR
jgi:hypothetical protein